MNIEFEQLKSIRNYLLGTVGSLLCSQVGSNEKILMLENARRTILNHYPPVHPEHLTDYQLNELGFPLSSSYDTLRMIPVWVYPFLSESVETICILDNSKHFCKNDIDPESVYGILAYGVVPLTDLSSNTIE